jgi:hypothetical protein
LVHLIVDATYFGERKEETCWCVVVARDMYKKEDLWWSFTKTETASVYRQMREELEALGYIIISVTGDGFGGIRTAFFWDLLSDVPGPYGKTGDQRNY